MNRLRAAVHETRCLECRVTWTSWWRRLVGDPRGMAPRPAGPPATAGWQYAVRHPGWTPPEHILRGPWLQPARMASWAAVDGVQLVRRRVGPWEPCTPPDAGAAR
jgi:hypothetical protein